MRTYYRFTQTIILAVLFTSIAFAQNPIPNPGFETWTEGYPNDWATNNIPGFYVPVTQSTSSHSGTYAAKGEVLAGVDGTYPPILFIANQQFQVSQNYTRMTGYYQMTNNGEDVLYVWMYLYDAQGSPVAYGEKELGQAVGGYQPFSVDLDYSFQSTEPAVGAYIYFIITLASGSELDDVTVGSSFLVDDLAMDNVSALSDQDISNLPLIYALSQNYPNPFNPETRINFSLPSAEQTLLTVYNSLGQVVRTLVNENLPAGQHQVTFNAAALPSGVYYYKLEAGSFSRIKKMMLVK
jgi:hypothetical protein